MMDGGIKRYLKNRKKPAGGEDDTIYLTLFLLEIVIEA